MIGECGKPFKSSLVDMQIKPADATSNLSEWLSLVTNHVPAFLASPDVDKWAVGFFLFSAIAVWFGPWLYRRLRPAHPPKITAPDPLTHLPPPNRIALMDFSKRAKQAGWDVSGVTNMEVGDLTDGLRQAAMDGLPMWGRLMRYGEHDYREPLTAIPESHWKDYQLDFGAIASGQANEKAQSYNPHQGSGVGSATKGGYSDLHVDSARASQWLANAALEFQGRRDGRKNSRYA